MPSFEWKIKGAVLKAIKVATKDAQFQGPIFSVYDGTLNLLFIPCAYTNQQMNVELFFNRPKKGKYANGIAAFVVSIAEINTTMSQSTPFGSHMYFRNIANFSDIQDCKSLTLKVETAIIQAIDENGTDVTHLYSEENDEESKESTESMKNQKNLRKVKSATLNSVLSKMDQLSTKMGKIENRLKDIELKLNEEEKGNAKDLSVDKIMNEIKLMKQDINKNKLSNNNINTEHQRLKSWLEIVVCLGQYYDIFIKNGIEDLSTVRLLTMDIIKGLGIDKIGHQIKLLNSITQLKHSHNEGGTALIQ